MKTLKFWPNITIFALIFLSFRLMLAALVILIMIVISNCCTLYFCCFATDYYGLWLKAYHNKDLLCLETLVGQNECHFKNSMSSHCEWMCLFLLLFCFLCCHVQVQNGLAVYTTWTSIASLINFSLVLNLWGVDMSTAATASLCILFAELMAW